CDPTGGRLPHEIFGAVRAVVGRFPGVAVGIHCHNDAGLAAANTLEAVRAGAVSVQGTINGLGERAGNADLTAVIPALQLKMGRAFAGVKDLAGLCALSRQVDDLANRRPFDRQPYVGRDAFTHKAGAHADGVRKNPSTFEHVAPESVGNERRVVVSELSGGASVGIKARELGLPEIAGDAALAAGALARLKESERKGYTYESADGSFKILLRKVLGRHTPFFELEGFRVVVEKWGREEPCLSEATVKVRVNGETELTAGEGCGPVDALNAALRKALRRFYPNIDGVALTDYRVRILDPGDATAAATRVLIESSDGRRFWGTVGVSENIIEASWQALVDSIEFKLHEDADAMGHP
ncbi:MAG: citramalate synthase, partial [Kiritimatiellaeota bacterium]|nr:citramalate synthase [Kiritimatiellota bacterium]